MSWNRLREDPCEVWTDIRQSAGPGTYLLSTPQKCNPGTFVADPLLSSQGAQVSICADRPLVDVDSELLGLTRRAAKCPQGKYQAASGACRLTHARDDPRLNGEFEPESTRDSNPTCTLRGTGWNRWEWLCEDPQRFAQIPFETHVNYRTVVKDNHRPLIPKLLADRSLPPPAPACVPVNATPNLALADLPPRVMRPHWRTAREIAKIRGEA